MKRVPVTVAGFGVLCFGLAFATAVPLAVDPVGAHGSTVASPAASAVRLTVERQTPLRQPTFGFLEVVNGVVVERPQRTPVAVGATEPITVEGWAVDRLGGAAAGGVVLAVVGRHYYWAGYGHARPDVARELGDPAYRDSGFRAQIPAGALTPGRHVVVMRVVTPGGRVYFAEHEPWQTLTLDVR